MDFFSVRETGQRVSSSLAGPVTLRGRHAWDRPYSEGIPSPPRQEVKSSIVRGATVDLDPGRRRPVTEALLAVGIAADGGWARVVEARDDATFDDVAPIVLEVLDGLVLGICGGGGPLLSALNLTPAESPVAGPAEATAPGAPSVPLAEAWPVTGVGYSLYRAQGRCVALAGRRGKGWVVYALHPALLAAGIAWVASRDGARAVG